MLNPPDRGPQRDGETSSSSCDEEGKETNKSWKQLNPGRYEDGNRRTEGKFG